MTSSMCYPVLVFRRIELRSLFRFQHPGLSDFVLWPAFISINNVFAVLLRSGKSIPLSARKRNILLNFPPIDGPLEAPLAEPIAAHPIRRSKAPNDL